MAYMVEHLPTKCPQYRVQSPVLKEKKPQNSFIKIVM
jgi:hypothetical protein